MEKKASGDMTAAEAALRELYRSVGAIEMAFKALEKRTDEDRLERNRLHSQNLQATGELRQDTTKAIAELRKDSSRAIDGLADQVRDLAKSVTAPQPQPTMEPHERRRLYALAAVGLLTVWIVGRLTEAGVTWTFGWLLRSKLGG